MIVWSPAKKNIYGSQSIRWSCYHSLRLKIFPQDTEIAALIINNVAKQRRKEGAIRSNKWALLSPLSLLVLGDESAADGGTMGVDTGAPGRFSLMKTELKSSEARAQFLDLVLDWYWTETLALGPILARLCLDLKLIWAVLSAVKSHEENSFSSSDGPMGESREGFLVYFLE